MKVLYVFALVAVFSVVVSSAPLAENQYQHLFSRFVEDFAKEYELQNFFSRYNLFKANIDTILAHNEKPNVGYTLAMNQFGDMSPQEFADTYLKLKPMHNLKSSQMMLDLSNDELPADEHDSLDWRTKGAVNPPRSQGQCGSCWAFSAAGAIEGAWQIATGELVSISEQQLVDCSKRWGNSGCEGGFMDNAYDYMIKVGGLCSEEDYPYQAKQMKCKGIKCKAAAKLTGYNYVPRQNETALKLAVRRAPVATGISAGNQHFQFYSSGVLTGECGKSLDHGVSIVGYGSERNATDGSMIPYWIIKNSWGASWGEEGYMRVVRGQNLCRVADAATIVTVKVPKTNTDGDNSEN